MANNNHLKLNECRPCVVLMQDTFDGVLSDRQPNNCNLGFEQPIAQLDKIYKDLNTVLQNRLVSEIKKKAARENKQPSPHAIERAQRTTYSRIIKVNPKDHRSFVSAEFSYGRRKLTYTNIASNANPRTNEKTTFCVKETTITATRHYKVARSMKEWCDKHQAQWIKAGYTGHFSENPVQKGIYSGTFTNVILKFSSKKSGSKTKISENKTVFVTGKRTSKTMITITLVQNITLVEDLFIETKPQAWIKEIEKEMAANNLSGEIRTFVNSFGKLVINGTYAKTEKVDKTSTNEYEIVFYNQAKKVKGDYSDYKPTKTLNGKPVEVRSIAQDDEYTPEFRGKKINWDRIEIEKLYQEYMKMPANELELSQKRFEAMDERAASKGDKTALKWLRSIKKSRPAWLQAPNAESLVLYCVKYLKQEVMTISEANNFCKNNAYKKTSV